MTNPHLGSSFSDFLDEEGIRDGVETRAIKQVLPGRFGRRWRQKGSPRARWRSG
jgi:hypothetical protein